ncbi:MAG TPA: SGNH/GDSL hydrolase family protein [Acidimicrobiia bacterium]
MSYYVAVGDSLATGDAAPPGSGYADDLLARWRSRHPGLTLQDFGCANETTVTMMHGGFCGYPQGNQLSAAEAFLRAHRSEVAVVTIDIGGDDVVGCGLNGLDVACLQRSLETVGANLRVILAGLRDAAGPGTPIVGMNYFDPFLTRWLEGPAGRSFAEATVPLDDQVSRILGEAYGAFGAPVADVEGAFATHDFTTMTARRYGTVPVNVAHVCDWLDATCTATGADLVGVDANASGHRVIADAFAAVTPSLSSAAATTDTNIVPERAGTGPAPAQATSSSTPGPTLPRTGGRYPVLAAGAFVAIIVGAGLLVGAQRDAGRYRTRGSARCRSAADTAYRSITPRGDRQGSPKVTATKASYDLSGTQFATPEVGHGVDIEHPEARRQPRSGSGRR